MDRLTFAEAVKRLEEVDAVVRKVDPLIRGHAFLLLRGYVCEQVRDVEVDELVQLVLMEAAKDAEQDLRGLLADVSNINKRKAKFRDNVVDRLAPESDTLELGRAVAEIVSNTPTAPPLLDEGAAPPPPEDRCDALMQAARAAAQLLQAVFLDRMNELVEQQRALATQRLRVMRSLQMSSHPDIKRHRLIASLAKSLDAWQRLLDKWCEQAIAERQKQFAQMERELSKFLEQSNCPPMADPLDVYGNWTFASEDGPPPTQAPR